MSNFNDFPRDKSKTTRFVVENIAIPDKLVRVFTYPVPIRGTRDLLKIRGVGEADIRASLLKGELRVKILAKELRVVYSDIDLLQFNMDEKAFLQSAGVVNGLEVSAGIGQLPYLFRDQIDLIGPRDGSNRVFYTPDKFLNGTYDGDILKIRVSHNGHEMLQGTDYVIEESVLGGGYDIVRFISIVPNLRSVLKADYMVERP